MKYLVQYTNSSDIDDEHLHYGPFATVEDARAWSAIQAEAKLAYLKANDEHEWELDASTTGNVMLFIPDEDYEFQTFHQWDVLPLGEPL